MKHSWLLLLAGTLLLSFSAEAVAAEATCLPIRRTCPPPDALPSEAPSEPQEGRTLRPRRTTTESRARRQQARRALLRSAERREAARNLAKERQALRRAVLTLVNAERTALDLHPLRANTLLERSAQAYGEDMRRRNFFGHTPPEGTTPRERIEAQGYGTVSQGDCNCRGFRVSFGENLAKGQDSAEQAVRDWMESPDHRANILSPVHEELGVGIALPYWVQHFGSVTLFPR